MLNNKQYISVAVVVLLAGVVGGGLMFWQVNKLASKNTVNSPASSVDRAEAEALNKAYAEAKKTDADLDGLSDVDEKALGTDVNKPDTDGDGLLDPTEATYKTNPLKADTDGDGKDDGWEVRRDFSPTGPGKLIINQ